LPLDPIVNAQAWRIGGKLDGGSRSHGASGLGVLMLAQPHLPCCVCSTPHRGRGVIQRCRQMVALEGRAFHHGVSRNVTFQCSPAFTHLARTCHLPDGDQSSDVGLLPCQEASGAPFV